MPDTARVARLIDALGTAASYNDKGHIWRYDSQEAIRDHRQSFEATLEALASEIGAEALGPELTAAIASGAAAHDGSGVFVDLARRQFGMPDRTS